MNRGDLEREVRRIRNKAGWDPGKMVKDDAEQTLRQLDQEFASERAYASGEECEACVAAREESGDETALCAIHLAEAMGF